MAIKNLEEISRHLFICNGGTCKKKGAEEGIVAIRAAIQSAGLGDSTHTTKTFCNGRCDDGPVVISSTEGIWFKGITKDVAEYFVEAYLAKRQLPEELVLFVHETEAVATQITKP